MSYTENIYGKISVGNSTSTNLGANSSFVGVADDVSNYASIKVIIFASTASAVDGFVMQFSHDNINWFNTDTYTIPAATSKTFSISVNAQWFRVSYQNTGSPSSSFFLETIYHTSAKQASSQKPSDNRSNENDAEETIAYTSNYDPTPNAWNRSRGTNGIAHVALQPLTAGGLTPFHLVSAASTNATNIKNTTGQVFGWYIYNNNVAARKVTFHNTTGTPTAGANVLFTLMIPPTSGANVEMTNGISFSSGIAITTTTGLADTDTTAVALNDLNINIFYK